MDERSYPRTRCEGVISISIDSGEEPVTARLKNLSRRGVCCVALCPIEVGARAHVDGLRTPLMGVVVRSEPGPGRSHIIAIRLAEPMDEGLFEHVLDGLEGVEPDEGSGPFDRQTQHAR